MAWGGVVLKICQVFADSIVFNVGDEGGQKKSIFIVDVRNG